MIDCKTKSCLEELYSQTAKLLIHKLRRMVPSELAEEISQEVFLGIWKDGCVFENVRAAYQYIYRCGHNRAIDALRRNRVWEGKLDQMSRWGQGDQWNDLLNRVDLTTAIHRLSEQQARVAWYCWVDGMTQDEVAEVEGISRKTVQRDLLKAQTKLSTILKEKANGAPSSVALSYSS